MTNPNVRRYVPLAAFAIGAGMIGGCDVLSGMFPKPGAPSDPDSFALIPPPQGEGVQIHIGPFDVPPGQELQQNFYRKLASDVAVDVKRVQIAMRDGSHHLNLFKSYSEDVPDKVEKTFEAVAFDKYDLFAGNQNRTMDWNLPNGVGMHFKAKSQLIIQSHYVNAGTQKTPEKGEAYINLWFAKPGEVSQRMGTLFANNTMLNASPIQPYSTASYAMNFTWARDVKIAALTGHFHSRGKRFVVWPWDGSQAGDPFYESKNWEEPPFKVLAGDGISVSAGKGIRFSSDYVNPTDKLIGFGPWVDVESVPPDKVKNGVYPVEHSNLFLFFYPANPHKELLKSDNRNDTTEDTAAAKGGSAP
ncbi:MAG: hypothetical protein FJZ00_11685 [Candidatus Sericytochromatia bacterium]|uniref:Uncharacterized protein n=1 Tax=Candidatus Tanganyikabacteria bacterium TaxID=2961651 RepID=A0A938BNW6_9BACT|nr:hypothetical protein [Candidatus Tanganyikabacteria bacterium]